MKKRLSVIITVLVVVFALTLTVISFAQEGLIRLNAKEINHQNVTVSISKSYYYYGGKALKPAVTVTYTDEEHQTVTLEKNKDYNVTYKNNDRPGIAEISVIGINAFSGTVKKQFKILPQTVSGLESTVIKRTLIGIKWTPQKNIDGYEISIKKASQEKYKLFFIQNDRSTFSFKQLKEATPYKIKIRSYYLLNDKKQFSKYSKVITVKTASFVDTPAVSGYCSLTSVPNVTWDKVKKADAYLIYRAKKKNGKYERIGVSKTNSFADKKAKLHKTFYYKVKARRVYKKKKYYSNFSNAVRIQAMKTVLVGDSVLESVQYYKTLPKATYCVKIGMGTYTFYSSYYFKVGGKNATGCEKVISYKPDRVFMMFGMNETAYKNNANILEYYQYAIEDIKASRPHCEIILLPVSPTRPTKDKGIPQKGRINSFNKALKKFAKQNGCKYYDFTPPFKDADGYLKKELDGGDGCHWKPSSCQLFIDQLNQYIKS